jgi:hypothetical protein
MPRCISLFQLLSTSFEIKFAQDGGEAKDKKTSFHNFQEELL